MNFLNKARRKVEEAVNEVRTAAQQAAQSQSAAVPQSQKQHYQARPYTNSETSFVSDPCQSAHESPNQRHQQAGATNFHSAPPLQQTPQPSQTSVLQSGLLKCLGSTAKLTKYTQFFVLKNRSPDSFGACISCYRSLIVPHQDLIHAFTPYHTIEDDKRFTCDFFLPSARAILKHQCIPQNSIQPLLDFVTLTESLTPCDGTIISTPGPYFQTKSEAIPNFAVCPTCFELCLRKTPFQDKFALVPDGTYGGTNQWTCDLAGPFYRRLLLGILESENPDFASFAEESSTRMSVPPCPGPGQPITQFIPSFPLVFTAQGGKSGNLCFACYCDCVANTSLEDAFVPATLTGDQPGNVSCDLAEPYSKASMEIAIKKSEDEIWRAAVSKMGRVGQCRGKAGSDTAFLKEKEQIGELANWYFMNEAPEIEICPHCFWLKVVLLSAAHLFSPITRPAVPSTVHMCFLTPSNAPEATSTKECDNFEDSMAWRGRRLSNSLELGEEIGDWSDLVTVGKAISNELPPCGGQVLGFKRASGRKWFGRVRQNSADPDDCTLAFCEECHARAVKGTPYETHYSSDLTEQAYQAEGTTGFVCQTYTNRSRGMLRGAAETGKFSDFARWWNIRDQLRLKKDMWQPLIQQQLLKMQLANVQQSSQMMLKMNAQRNALAAIGSAGAVEAAMSDTGERWGNSQVGTDHWTKGSADAEQQWQNASNMKVSSGAGDLGIMGETQRLFMMAQVDENAFKAVE